MEALCSDVVMRVLPNLEHEVRKIQSRICRHTELWALLLRYTQALITSMA